MTASFSERRVRFLDAGSGTPAVILESGAGGFSALWGLVQPLVAETTRVISYDRAGCGRSDPVNRPRTASVLADELQAFLRSAGVPPPYVLVGHAFGGFVVRMYARRHPSRVAGMVLVDALHEDEWSRAYPDAHRRSLKNTGRLMGVLAALSLLGIPQLVARLRLPGVLRSLPAAARQALARDGFSRQSLRTIHQEFRDMEQSATEIRNGESSLGDRPLVVITHGRAGRRIRGWGDHAAAAEAERVARLSQRHLAQLSTRSEMIVAGRSGHEIMLDEPGIVVGAIRTVVEAVREAGRFVR